MLLDPFRLQLFKPSNYIPVLSYMISEVIDYFVKKYSIFAAVD